MSTQRGQGHIGLLAVRTDAAKGLHHLVDAAYEKRSITVSSNLHPAGFDGLMPKTLATTTVDRLLHHAHVCQTSGESSRPTQALAWAGRDAGELALPPRMANAAKLLVGRSVGHEWAVFMATSGHFPPPPVGRSSRPLTLDRATKNCLPVVTQNFESTGVRRFPLKSAH
nr:ATP-binding protein [Cryobacterium gelidum]